MAMLLMRTGASWSSIILLLIEKWQCIGGTLLCNISLVSGFWNIFHLVGQLTNVHVVLPINQTRHLASVSEEIFGSCCLISTDELLMKSDNVQVALPNQPLLLELPSLLQSLLYRCDQNWSSASKKSWPYVNREFSLSDFVGQAVFEGDPTALPGSEVEYLLKKINT